MALGQPLRKYPPPAVLLPYSVAETESRCLNVWSWHWTLAPLFGVVSLKTGSLGVR